MTLQRRILGIDPGTASTGFGIVDVDGSRVTPVWYDCLTTPSTDEPVERLATIAKSVRLIIEKFQPQEAAVEDLFFGAGPRVALQVGQARGATMLVCYEAGLTVHEYAPTVIKQSVAGHGRAEKQQVQEMVRAQLSMTEIPRPNHAADALAVALTHAWAGAYDARARRRTRSST